MSINVEPCTLFRTQLASKWPGKNLFSSLSAHLNKLLISSLTSYIFPNSNKYSPASCRLSNTFPELMSSIKFFSTPLYHTCWQPPAVPACDSRIPLLLWFQKPTGDFSQNWPVSYSDGGPSKSDEESSEFCSDVDAIEAVPLRMCRPESGIEWSLRKVLSVSDCNAQHRFLITKDLMQSRIIPHLAESSGLVIDTPDGLWVNVFDVDVGVELKLTMKKWPSSKAYGLMNNWKRDFVNRRGLLPGDLVGICWDK